ncbi:MAG: dipicolinate synthase subunit B [Symbiobacterium thermophilum]|uniref:Dipicolinate synthase subunit B n=1 Tax=Symbiobacterium thermophilum TaxID=2734 RepID=A0A1Y2T417_SYMTR|nr:MAG: dipicolinate synthase subunit B [Symbiobacterium thermophilum]
MSVQQLAGKRIGVAMSASHCNLGRAMAQLRRLRDEGAEIIPIISTNVRTTETRFGKPDDWITQIEQITGRLPLMTIPEVEPFGPRVKLDCLVIMPCTGNTMAKLANAINDTPVCMAAKAQMRNHRPVVLAVTTNDGLGMNARNLGALLVARNIYFVPFRQDDPFGKPTSIDADIEHYLVPTILAAMEGRQVQPLLLGPKQA